MARRKASSRPAAILLAAVAAALAVTGGLVLSSGGEAAPEIGTGMISAVGAESQYADVIAQVGGRYVRVSALLSNPSTDPHSFEASSAVARQVGGADLIVQNGLGYDSFMNTLEGATPNATRTVIDVQRLLNLPDSTANPHLWYDPGTMPRVAAEVAASLARLQPGHAAYFKANAAAFTRSLRAWDGALAGFRAAHPGTPIATTEPVADYLLKAAGTVNLTPWTFQADIMNGTDPSPQDVATVRALLTGHRVRALVYNVQVTGPLTQSLVTLARQQHIPVVGVYETMPQPGYRYQSWMLGETAALQRAVEQHTSTEHL